MTEKQKLINEVKEQPHFKTMEEAKAKAIELNRLANGEVLHWVGKSPSGEYGVFIPYYMHPAFELAEYSPVLSVMDILYIQEGKEPTKME